MTECSCCCTVSEKYKGFQRIAIHFKIKGGPIEEKISKKDKKSVILVSKTQITPTYHIIAKKAKVISNPRKVYQRKLMSRKSLTEQMVSPTVNNTHIENAI
ncbi:hypothetical protein ACJMK2_029290 [Sinanodonta woodiana]|uniref:Uncharacterized protein n=1 Tax=Sinanodonta woodiana TaxID=1069815 RepID=A0ABD3X9Q4_SINWO